MEERDCTLTAMADGPLELSDSCNQNTTPNRRIERHSWEKGLQNRKPRRVTTMAVCIGENDQMDHQRQSPGGCESFVYPTAVMNTSEELFHSSTGAVQFVINCDKEKHRSMETINCTASDNENNCASFCVRSPYQSRRKINRNQVLKIGDFVKFPKHSVAFIFLFILYYDFIPATFGAQLPATSESNSIGSGEHQQWPIIDDNHHSFKHCSHQYPKPHEIIHGAFIEPHHIMRKRSINQPLRIVLYYDESVHSLDQEKKELINNTVLPQAISYWERALMVRKTERAIVLNRRCPNQQVFYKADDPHPYCKVECEAKTMCGEVQVPEEHLDVCRVCNENGTNCRVAPNSKAGPGIADADFVFYVSAVQTHRCKHGFTVAYAAHCQQESALDRPIAGHANLCPKSISTKPQELETLISTVKHEILHALGFSVSLYAFYRDEHGYPLTPRDNKGKPPLNAEMQARQWSDRVIRKVTRRNWRVREGNITRTMQMIVTKRVVEEVRRHFNCPDLEGAELEDQGEEGTALTHWEKRIFENEAMTGTHTQNPVYSRITLALMEDTGWYRANYAMAQHLAWGHQLGCDFAKKSCMEWMNAAKLRGEDPLPYCNKVKAEPLETQCTDDHSSVALCNLVRYPSRLSEEYQNFDRLPNVPDDNVTFYGGSVTLADYCPYVQEFTWRANSVVIRGSHCLYDENNPEPDKNFALEDYGKDSKCFYHTKEMWEERSCHQKRHWQHWGSGCYKYMCDGGQLHILVTNRTFTCSYTGQEIKIQLLANGWLHRGGIKCPSCKNFCDDCSDEQTSYEVRDFPRDNLECSAAVSTVLGGPGIVLAISVAHAIAYVAYL